MKILISLLLSISLAGCANPPKPGYYQPGFTDPYAATAQLSTPHPQDVARYQQLLQANQWLQQRVQEVRRMHANQPAVLAEKQQRLQQLQQHHEELRASIESLQRTSTRLDAAVKNQLTETEKRQSDIQVMKQAIARKQESIQISEQQRDRLQARQQQLTVGRP